MVMASVQLKPTLCPRGQHAAIHISFSASLSWQDPVAYFLRQGIKRKLSSSEGEKEGKEGEKGKKGRKTKKLTTKIDE